MEGKTKIHLSPLENKLILDKEWILTKRTVMHKVSGLFGQVQSGYRQILLGKEDLPGILDNGKKDAGKLSRGENYEGLPYVMLDYPAKFSREDIFAVRTFFWWGNFISLTLLLSGKSVDAHRFLPEGLALLADRSFYVGIHEDPWKHDFSPDNYVLASDPRAASALGSHRPFVKISRQIGLEHWQEAEGFLEDTFRDILDYLRISFRGGETGL
ncbi:MAG: hypothetical protein KGM98_14460 [Bacteroidota bacterium]|nr:hypothetical protein [Bacteroidota bacterium]